MTKKFKKINSLKVRVLLGISVILILLLGIASFRSYKLLLNNIEQKVFVNLQKELISTSEKINNFVVTDINLVKNISVIFSNYNAIPEDYRRDFFQENLKVLIEENNEIYGLWTIFKPFSIDSFDTLYANETNNLTGQFVATYFRENGKIIEQAITLDDYSKLDDYLTYFNENTNNVFIIAPLVDPYWELMGTSYIIRIVVPVVVNNKIIGLIGLDLNYEFLKLFFTNPIYNEIIVDDDMNVIYNEDYRLINKNFLEIYPFISNNKELLRNIAIKKEFSKKAPLYNPNETSFYSVYSMDLKDASNQWSIIFSTSNKAYLSKAKKQAISIFIGPIIIFIVLFLFFLTMINYMTTSLKEISQNLNKLFRKKNTSAILLKSQVNEFAEIYNVLEKTKILIDKYQLLTELIINEKFDKEIKFEEKDVLSDNLFKIKEKLVKEQKEREKQKEKQDIENNISNALAQINNIQRSYNDDLDQLTYSTTKFIADFIDAIQGGFYVVNRTNEDNPVLELKAFYSYNRRIFTKKQIEFSDGLAGTCAIEKKHMYSKVPQNYLEISSGLGSTPPNFIFLLPLVNNDEIMGVLEFAFINDLLEHNKNFLLDAADVIASSIASSENNTKTFKLLAETRDITNRMQEKEEQMNQHISQLEELKIENEISELDRSAILSTINKIVYFAEFDQKTSLLSINKNLSDKLQIQASDAMMLTYFDVLMITDNEKHHGYWKKVFEGNSVEFDLPIFLGKFNFWLTCILSPVYNASNEIYKVIFFAIDITEIKQKEEDVKKLMVEMNEKAEQISVQEMEMDEFFEEYQKMQDEVTKMENKITEANEVKDKATQSLLFLQKEFKKRNTRSKRIEMNLKKKIRSLEIEIKNLKEE